MIVTAVVVLVIGLVGTILIKRDEAESEKADRKEAESTSPAKPKATTN